MRRTALLLSVAVTFALTPVGTAGAGGWWSGIDGVGSHVGIGESLKSPSEVWFRTMEVAEKARTTAYYAYLVRGIDEERLRWAMSRPQPKRWWTPPKWSVPIGNVELSHWDANIAVATAHMEVPDLPTGTYYLMLCDAGCRTPLGSIVPTRVHVSHEPLAAQTARKLERASMKSNLAIRRLSKDLRETNRQVVDLEAQTIESTRAIEQLQKEPSSPEPVPSPTPWWAFGGWFVGGAATAIAITHARRSHSVRLEEPPMELIPDDARELIDGR